MVAALHANSAFYKVDNGPETREQMITAFNDACDEVIVRIYDARSDEEINAAEMSDPFIAAVDLSHSIVETEEQKRERRKMEIGA